MTAKAIHGPLLALAVLASPAALAQLYGGVGVGLARTAIDKNAIGITGATTSTLSKNDKDFGAKVYGGYQFNRNFAMELGYVDLGKIKATRTMIAPGSGSATVTAENSAVFLDLVGIAPLGAGSTSLIGRVGRIVSTTDKTFAYTGAVIGTASTSREKEANWKFGAGAQFEIDKSMAARAEWERHTRLGTDSGTGQSLADLFSVNFLVRFK